MRIAIETVNLAPRYGRVFRVSGFDAAGRVCWKGDVVTNGDGTRAGIIADAFQRANRQEPARTYDAKRARSLREPYGWVVVDPDIYRELPDDDDDEDRDPEAS